MVRWLNTDLVFRAPELCVRFLMANRLLKRFIFRFL